MKTQSKFKGEKIHFKGYNRYNKTQLRILSIIRHVINKALFTCMKPTSSSWFVCVFFDARATAENRAEGKIRLF